jgi:hypothetical protein
MIDKYLDKSTVINLVYTGQATRMADEYARLKAERDALYAELERIYRAEPLLREAIASAVLASKGVQP